MRIRISRRSRVRLGTGIVLVAAAAPAALAATASAQPNAVAHTGPTIAVGQACYVYVSKARPPVTITGSGFTPSMPVLITDSTGQIDTTVTADPTGAITATVAAPYLDLTKPSAESDTITANQAQSDGSQLSTTTPAQFSAIGAEHGTTKPAAKLKALTETTNWLFSGYTTGQEIYGHYLYGKKVVATTKFGKATGPCGLLKVRARLYPATPTHSKYTVQVDNAKKYSAKTTPKLSLKVALNVAF